MNKQTFTQLNGPSTGNGGGTNLGNRKELSIRISVDRFDLLAFIQWKEKDP